ncbi:cytochrome c oxidase subunit II [Haloarcula montana]|uniref:cytochrome c oxidase subunit II n=1 Tax=Haloarcula montana TaxID=3111776 RepID=UPI002D77E118|nr:cytochrome c oxidase subunit II [Haloarcula sp. GH36]
MHVHRFERLWLVGALTLIVLFVGTVTYGAVGAGYGMVDDTGGEVDPTNAIASENFREPGVYDRSEAGRYDVYVEAKQFMFVPGTSTPVRVPANSTVTFHVTSTDVMHGFEVVGTNINTMAVPGQVATVTVEFDEPAQYGLVCNEYCGSGHHTMEGSLEVVPHGQFNESEVN